MLLFCNPWQANDLAELHAACFVGHDAWSANFILQQLKNPAVVGLATHDGKKILSFGLFQIVDEVADVLTLATLPKHRRRGHAKAILTTMVGLLPPGGKLWLEVADNNATAMGLYKNIGFHETTTRPNYYRDGQTAKLLMLQKDN